MADNEDGSEDVGDATLPLPIRNWITEAEEEHDRLHMTMDQRRMELWAFLDGLSAEQLLALRSILNYTQAGVNYVDGMAANQLRLQHKVDPETGEPLLVT